MTDKKEYADRFIREFTGKLFYFCLKKTGNIHEAEDLSADICLSVLTSLERGSEPENFPAWVWRVARNRYSVWADKKRIRAEHTADVDLTVFEPSDGSAVDLGLIHSEELSLLRRELAFISGDYRDVVVAYYIEDRSVREIARSLGVPEGTVKARLFRARNILKEGMNMAKEFGTRSYRPDEVSFTTNCSRGGDEGQPWSVMRHRLYQNIFLEVYGNPMTAEDIALALGIALPYMEDELEYLTGETFLKKTGSRYETTFPIISRAAQENVHKISSEAAEKAAPLFMEMIDGYLDACEKRGLDPYGGYITREDAGWTLLPEAIDNIGYRVRTAPEFVWTKRPQNGEWDIIGYQSVGFREPIMVGKHGCGLNEPGAPEKKVTFQQFRYYSLEKERGYVPNLTFRLGEALQMFCEGKADECDVNDLAKLAEYGYIRRDGDEYIPRVVVFRDKAGIAAKLDKAERERLGKIRDELTELISDAQKRSLAILTDDLPKSLRDDDHVLNLMRFAALIDRGYYVERAIEGGWLTYDAGAAPMLGAYVRV